MLFYSLASFLSWKDNIQMLLYSCVPVEVTNAFSIPAHLEPYKFILTLVSLSKVKDKCLLSIQDVCGIPSAFCKYINCCKIFDNQQVQGLKKKKKEEGIHGNSNCYLP